jgi:transcriptional regulator with XRE-family HTH domain
MTTTTKPKETHGDPEVAKRFSYFINTYVKDSQRGIAEKLGISQPMISYMKTGKNAIGFKVTRRLIKEYKLNAKWLATGDPNEHPISNPSPDSPTLMGQGIKELRKEVIDLKATIMQMESAIYIMEVNQNFFLKRISHLLEEKEKK